MPVQPLKHKAEFAVYMEGSRMGKTKKVKQKPEGFTKHNFKLKPGVPLFRLDTMQTVEL